jgi:hypothetical protein
MLDPSQDDDCLRPGFLMAARVPQLGRILCPAPIVLGDVGFIAKPLNPGD